MNCCLAYLLLLYSNLMKHGTNITWGIIVGVIGIWGGFTLSMLYISWQLALIPPVDCSGLNPCSEETSIYLVGFCLGGVISAMLTSGTIRYLMLKRIDALSTVAYGFVGLIFWPVVAVVSFLIAIIPAEILIDIPGLTQSGFYIALFMGLAVCGGTIGFLVWNLIRINNPELYENNKSL